MAVLLPTVVQLHGLTRVWPFVPFLKSFEENGPKATAQYLLPVHSKHNAICLRTILFMKSTLIGVWLNSDKMDSSDENDMAIIMAARIKNGREKMEKKRKAWQPKQRKQKRQDRNRHSARKQQNKRKQNRTISLFFFFGFKVRAHYNFPLHPPLFTSAWISPTVSLLFIDTSFQYYASRYSTVSLCQYQLKNTTFLMLRLWTTIPVYSRQIQNNFNHTVILQDLLYPLFCFPKEISGNF